MPYSQDGLSYTSLEVFTYCSVILPSINWSIFTAISFLDSSTPYEYDSRTRIFHQPAASRQLLRRFLSVNNVALKSLKIVRPIDVGALSHFQIGMPLVQLIDAGIKDPKISSDVLSATLEQLEHQTEYESFQSLFVLYLSNHPFVQLSNLACGGWLSSVILYIGIPRPRL